MTISEELPQTKEALLCYLRHSERQIEDSHRLINKMKNRIQGCILKLYFIDKELAQIEASQLNYVFEAKDGKLKLVRDRRQ